MSEEATTVLDALADAPAHIDDLCRNLDVLISELSSRLMILKLNRLVEDIGGMVFEKV